VSPYWYRNRYRWTNLQSAHILGEREDYFFISNRRVTNCPAAQIPAANVPKEKIPNEKTPTEKMPTENSPAEKTPTEKTPAESTPVLNTPPDNHPDAAVLAGMSLGKGGLTRPTISRTRSAPQIIILTVRRVMAIPPFHIVSNLAANLGTCRQRLAYAIVSRSFTIRLSANISSFLPDKVPISK
jgi:hypothetical protein